MTAGCVCWYPWTLIPIFGRDWFYIHNCLRVRLLHILSFWEWHTCLCSTNPYSFKFLYPRYVCVYFGMTIYQSTNITTDQRLFGTKIKICHSPSSSSLMYIHVIIGWSFSCTSSSQRSILYIVAVLQNLISLGDIVVYLSGQPWCRIHLLQLSL